MLPTKQLFRAEEAFVRVGQLRETGCLVIIHAESTVRLFVEKGSLVHACAETEQGMPALQRALSFADASHLWLPDVQTPQKGLSVDIPSFAQKNSIAPDIHLARTTKVQEPEPPTTVAPMPTGQTLTKDMDRKRVTEPLPAPKQAPYYLLEEGRPAKKLEIHKGTATIGRHESCDIVLADVQVSRRHCILQVTAKGLRFRDLNSSNGISVNGKPVKEGFLKVGDKLKVGTSQLEVYGEA
jgi:hypothetical protein